MVRKPLRLLTWLALGLGLLLATLLVAPAVRALDRSLTPRAHGDLAETRVHAYRGWQGLGVQLHEGDLVQIEAGGEWLYTPGEYHGPAGHARFSAPEFYPLPGVAGGALIGRVGETGAPFLVGERWSRVVDREGMLYLRINDDLLGDNDGYVLVDVEIAETEED